MKRINQIKEHSTLHKELEKISVSFEQFCFVAERILTSFILSDGKNEKGDKVSDNEEDLIIKCLEIMNSSPRGLCIMGKRGTGKTLFFDIYRRVYDRVYQNKKGSLQKNALRIITTRYIEDNYGKISFRKWDNCEIVIDDLGYEDSINDYSKKIEPVEKLIMHREDVFRSKGIRTHYTTNCDPDQIQKKYDKRAYDRLSGMAEVVVFNGDSKRKESTSIRQENDERLNTHVKFNELTSVINAAYEHLEKCLKKGYYIESPSASYWMGYLLENKIIDIPEDAKKELTKEASEYIRSKYNGKTMTIESYKARCQVKRRNLAFHWIFEEAKENRFDIKTILNYKTIK